jgi:transcription antitermination factor NusG
MKENDKNWYPIRVTYSQEMKIKSYFDSCQLTSFIPMKYTETHKNGHLRLKQVPVIHNLIFVYCTSKEIEQIKRESPISTKIRYIIDSETRKPIIVPEKQMEDFIAVSGSIDEQILYLTPQEVALKNGDYVRITDGIWKGIEGKLVRIKKNLRVVVELQGLAAVATTSIHPSLVEKIEK